MNGSEEGRRKVLRERFKADEAINLAWNSQASKAATPRQGSDRGVCGSVEVVSCGVQRTPNSVSFQSGETHRGIQSFRHCSESYVQERLSEHFRLQSGR